MLVFFDDIVVYFKSWEKHIKHVYKVFQIIENKFKLYVKMSKYVFGKQQVEYLGYTFHRKGSSLTLKRFKLS